MIDQQMREMIKAAFDHPDEIKYLKFYMKLRNGAELRYQYDQPLAEKLKAREMVEEARRKERQTPGA